MSLRETPVRRGSSPISGFLREWQTASLQSGQGGIRDAPPENTVRVSLWEGSPCGLHRYVASMLPWNLWSLPLSRDRLRRRRRRRAVRVKICDQRRDPTYGTGAGIHFIKAIPMPKAGGRRNTLEITAGGRHLVVVLNGKKDGRFPEQYVSVWAVRHQAASVSDAARASTRIFVFNFPRLHHAR